MEMIISKIIMPLILKGSEALFNYLWKLFQDYLNEKKEDKTDEVNRDLMKNPNRGEVARRINEGFPT